MTLFSQVWSDHDKKELAQSLHHAVKCIQEGDLVQAAIALRFSKGLVNNMHAIDLPAKAYLLSIFAELHLLIDSTNQDAELFFDQFLRAMMHIYGDAHAVIGDCYNVISNSRASQGRFDEAIMYAAHCLLNRISTVGLMHELTAQAHYNLALLYRLRGDIEKSKQELQICRGIWSTLAGDISLEVAATDMSLGQTEKVGSCYDRSYLSFTLAYRTRHLLLGKTHYLTTAALHSLQSVKRAAACEFITSVELMDRMEELGWMNISPPTPPPAIGQLMQRITIQLFADGRSCVVLMVAKLRNVMFSILNAMDVSDLLQISVFTSNDYMYDIDALCETLVRSLIAPVSDEFIARRRTSINERISLRHQSKSTSSTATSTAVPPAPLVASTPIICNTVENAESSPPLSLTPVDNSDNICGCDEIVPDTVPSLSHSSSGTSSSPASVTTDDDVRIPVGPTRSMERRTIQVKLSCLQSSMYQSVPRLSGHRLLLIKDIDNQRVTIRRTTGTDVLDALKIKIIAAGIFPLLLLPNPAEQLHVKELSDDLNKQFPAESLLSEKSISDEVVAPLPEEEKILQLEEARVKTKIIPTPPPLPTSWPPRVCDGKNVQDVATSCGSEGPVAAMITSKLTGGGNPLLGAISAAAGLKRQKNTNSGPKLKQFHWDMTTEVPPKGSLWEEAPPVKIVVAEIFPDLVESFAPSMKKSAVAAKLGKSNDSAVPGGVTAALLSRSKQATVLDGQKSQNINIMLAKFGSRTKIENIIEAICTLDITAFVVPTVLSMMEFIPQPDEVTAVTGLVAEHGIEKIGKAEAYLYKISKVPRVELYLRSLLLLLTMQDTKDQTLAAADTIQQACSEIKGSSRLRIIMNAILVVGNTLNEGTKKSNATGFKLNSLAKLTQTKSNDNETLLEYILGRLGRALPDAVNLQDDMRCLESAAHVSFPVLQADIGKIDAGIKTLNRLKSELQSRMDEEKSKSDSFVGSEYNALLDRINVYISEATAIYDEISRQYDASFTAHQEICCFLGEELNADPESVYGQVNAFVAQVTSTINKLKL